MSIRSEITVFIFNAIYTAAPFLLLASFPVFWGGVVWLMVALLRQNSVRRPLGIALLGFLMGFFGFSFSLSELLGT